MVVALLFRAVPRPADARIFSSTHSALADTDIGFLLGRSATKVCVCVCVCNE